MKFPAFISPYVEGDSPKRLLQGLVVGAVATLIIGFNWGDWQLGSTSRENVETASRDATVAALAPICAEKFELAASTDGDLLTELGALNSWDRDSHLIKAGWVTFAGSAQPDNNVAAACARLISETLILK